MSATHLEKVETGATEGWEVILVCWQHVSNRLGVKRTSQDVSNEERWAEVQQSARKTSQKTVEQFS